MDRCPSSDEVSPLDDQLMYMKLGKIVALLWMCRVLVMEVAAVEMEIRCTIWIC